MSISNEQKNLIDNLKLPMKSFRIFALEEAIRIGDCPELLSAIEEIKIFEDDPEVVMLINHAISAVGSRIDGSKKNETEKIDDYSNFLSKWQKSDENQRMELISNLPPRLPKEIRQLGPELLEGSSPVIAARVIRTFSRNWPKDKINLITENLHSDSLALKLAALRTLVHQNPEILLPDLPNLLVSSDPEIKALAIRGLVKIDKEEALNHLQALLLSSSTNERLAGIQNCPFLPFEMVKPLLLKYFAAENNPELLTKAGWIIEMNPDTEVPFRLFEISERSPSKKADLVKKVLNEAVKLLKKSGILGKQFAAYTVKLQDWVDKRNALRYVRQIVAKLDVQNVTQDTEKNILVVLKQKIYQDTFLEAYNTWPLSDLAKSNLAKYLGIESASQNVSNQTQESQKLDKSIEQDGQIENQAELQDQTQTQPQIQTVSSSNKNLSQLEMLATISPQKASEKIDQIILMITHKNSAVDIKIAALQCLTRCRLSGAEDIATRLIKNSDVSLATAAVEYLGIVNPDAIFPYLGQCLNVSDVGMKSAALGILKNFDYNQAISYLRAMLHSTDTNQQSMALECMNQFDFALIRDMLTEFLCLDYPESILEAGLCQFAANPSADNIYSLYKIEQAHFGKIAHQAKSLREACSEPEKEIVSAFTENENQITEQKDDKDKQKSAQEAKKAKEAELKERLRVEKEKKASQKPAYAYRSASEEPQRTSKEQLKIIYEAIVSFSQTKTAKTLIVVASIALIVFYLSFFYTPSTGKKKVKGGPLISVPKVYEGKILTVINNSVTMEASTGDHFVFSPLKYGWKLPVEGWLIRIQLKPIRRYGDKNIILAEVGDAGYKKIKKYTKQFSGDKAK